jgi:hypothetical protein
MRFSVNKALAVAALTTGVLLGANATAHASFDIGLQFTVSGTLVPTSTLSGGTLGGTGATITGAGTIEGTGLTLSYAGSLGSGVSVTLTETQSFAPDGTMGIDVTNLTITDTNGLSVEILSSATGFTSPVGSALIMTAASSTTNQTNGGSAKVTYEGFGSTSNSLFDMSGVNTTSSNYTVSGQNGVGGGNISKVVALASTYSLTEERLLTNVTTGDTISGGTDNLDVTPTPVPSTAVLALTGLPLLGLGFLVRRRMTRKDPVAA